MLFYTGAEDKMEEDLNESGVLKVLGKIFCYYPSGITVRSAPHPVMCARNTLRLYGRLQRSKSLKTRV